MILICKILFLAHLYLQEILCVFPAISKEYRYAQRFSNARKVGRNLAQKKIWPKYFFEPRNTLPLVCAKTKQFSVGDHSMIVLLL